MTTSDRRAALRTTAGLAAAGALADCSTPRTPTAAPPPRPLPSHPRQPHPRIALTFHGQGAPAVTRNVTTEIRNGSVVSLHFGYADTVAAFPALLDELDRRGLRAVTTTELLN